MTPGRLREWPYQIHAYLLKGDADNGARDEGRGRWFPGRSPLALEALLTEGPDFGIHPGPEEPVPQLDKSVVGPEVAAERMAVGQVHWGQNLGVRDDKEVTQLTSVLQPEVEEAIGH